MGGLNKSRSFNIPYHSPSCQKNNNNKCSLAPGQEAEMLLILLSYYQIALYRRNTLPHKVPGMVGFAHRDFIILPPQRFSSDNKNVAFQPLMDISILPEVKDRIESQGNDFF